MRIINRDQESAPTSPTPPARKERPRLTLLTRVTTLRHLTGAGVVALVVAVLFAVPAQAASSTIHSNYSNGANLRNCANTSCYSLAYLANGTGVDMICFIDAQSVSPPNSNYTSARWFKVNVPSTAQLGYVHSSLVQSQTSVPRC